MVPEEGERRGKEEEEECVTRMSQSGMNEGEGRMGHVTGWWWGRWRREVERRMSAREQ